MSTAVRRLAVPATLLLPGGLTVYLAFTSGGYFPGATAVAALALLLVLLVRAVAADNPFGGLGSPILAVAASALALYAVWTLVSGIWSDAPARALVEFDRALLYLVALVLFGTVGWTPGRLRVAVWGVAAAAFVVSLAGLLVRTLPDVFPLAPEVQVERLGYPIGYWNALGLIAAIGLILCVHLASSERDPAPIRVAAAAAAPVPAATLLFTFSRGPIAGVVVGLVAYLVVARPRLLPTALLAGGPPTAIALITAYHADLLASDEPAAPAAVAQGHHVARVVAICVLAGAVARALLLFLDRRLERLRLRPQTRRPLAAAAAAATVLAALGIWLGTDAVDRIEAQTDRFARSDVPPTGDLRDRLTDPGNNRLDGWEVALDAFHDAPVKGEGAGTFELRWDRDRPTATGSINAHSLYLETMGELGLVGLALLATGLGAILLGAAARAHGPERAVHGAVFAVALTWALHAGIDWDWEVPAVTLLLLALGGLALAAPANPPPATGPRAPIRTLALAVCLGLAATPALLAASQDRFVKAVEAYERGDCREAIRSARSSISALGSRPEPYEVLSYCQAAQGRGRRAVDAMESAVDRDPRNWRYRYGLALVRAGAGLDPRSAAREAHRLNPIEPRVRNAVNAFRADTPRQWRRAARYLGLELAAARR